MPGVAHLLLVAVHLLLPDGSHARQLGRLLSLLLRPVRVLLALLHLHFLLEFSARRKERERGGNISAGGCEALVLRTARVVATTAVAETQPQRLHLHGTATSRVSLYLEQLLEEAEGHEGVEVEGDHGAEPLVLHVDHGIVDRHVRAHLPYTRHRF